MKLHHLIVFTFILFKSYSSEKEHFLEKFKAYSEKKLSPCGKYEWYEVNLMLQFFYKDPAYAHQLKELSHLLLECEPNNPDYLFYYGRAEFLLGNDQEAILSLEKCLSFSLNYTDAAWILSTLYRKNKEFKKAKSLLKNFKENPLFEERLADIYVETHHVKKGIQIYENLHKKYPFNLTITQKLADALQQDIQYERAKLLLLNVSIDQRPTIQLQLDELNLMTQPRLFYQLSYLESKENDPTIKKPVVRDYYFDQGLYLTAHLKDRFTFDTKFIDFRQKEIDIYPPTGTNYDAQIYGLDEKIFYKIHPQFQLGLNLRGFFAYSLAKGFYPFQNSWRFEPGINILYSPPSQYLLLDAHVESFIIKNFTNFQSYLLRLDYLDIGYRYHFEKFLNLDLIFNLMRIFFHDSYKNKKDVENVELNLNIPLKKNWIKGKYFFEHSSFRYLNINYFSYKNQWVNKVGFETTSHLGKNLKIILDYEHSWQVSTNLVQPIGNYIYIAKRQSLIGNKISIDLICPMTSHFDLFFHSHYFQNNLPYREYQIKGGLGYLF